MNKIVAAAIALLIATEANAADRSFEFINCTDRTIAEIYVSRVESTKWGRDILPEYLRSGESVYLEPDQSFGSCEFDIKAVYRDGESVVMNGINLCNGYEVVLREERTTNYSVSSLIDEDSDYLY